ncbi:hypothetical protein AMYX_22000 [Anaeromyxobacter diazotrophicus]|uniref:Uncharacterized protein n=2 Tax=Anaeromyxobacter diazotrophicus TaxID=2590199 RepID=A0A7I9VMV0_9BACT|nr:hypothetical protein AMYX_22000 [Anaeromyxobacter diazotrophicus]
MQALGMGARAAGRSAWLVAPALLVGFLRSALGWPAPLLALALLRAGAAGRLAGGARAPGEVVAGALAALTAPRSLCLLAGLFLAGLLASAALRVAWLAGALPTLGGALHGEREPAPRFAAGVTWGFAPLAGTALLGLALELAAQLYLWTAALSALVLALHRAPPLVALVRAGLGAVALASALAAPPLASLAADAALARTALTGDRPARALLEGLRRVALRPAAFVLAGMTLGLAALVVLGSAQALESAALGLAAGAPAVLAVGPRLMTTVLAASLAALFELWRLGTVAALACAER